MLWVRTFPLDKNTHSRALKNKNRKIQTQLKISMHEMSYIPYIEQ